MWKLDVMIERISFEGNKFLKHHAAILATKDFPFLSFFAIGRACLDIAERTSWKTICKFALGVDVGSL